MTILLAGRAMTLAYIARAGGPGASDPPIGWLMPLLGDAFVGVTAAVVAYVLFSRSSLWAWALALVWNAVAIWDAASAFIIHLTVPWPTFFMIELFGSSMFFAAIAMHLVCIVLLSRTATRHSFGIA